MGKNPDTALIASKLQHNRALKFGHLYQCSECKLHWFLDDDGLNMHGVTLDKIDLLFEWSDSKYIPTVNQFKILNEIGATGADQYGNGRGTLYIPCRIDTVSGNSIDKALVLITKKPPIDDWRQTIILGNAVSDIEPSDYALPLTVRLANLNADEIRMGFAPTAVQSKDDRYFILNWTPYFFFYGPLLGKDISLCNAEFCYSSDIPIYQGIESDQIAFVYYDWFNGCESLDRSSQ
ncbi:hypothetical protein V144x_02470 [Gimesia aquarii]|uniref:Uncharacterized protein n=1 Tax=Gimesia aquarii TaxID=2527964 RepID=A0A517VP73_9PLAN|nr:hypothetical protein V144x_02470 [Gimesia aquarii]